MKSAGRERICFDLEFPNLALSWVASPPPAAVCHSWLSSECLLYREVLCLDAVTSSVRDTRQGKERTQLRGGLLHVPAVGNDLREVIVCLDMGTCYLCPSHGQVVPSARGAA